MARVGITSEILDGNLKPVVSLPEDVVLVVSRSTTGPSNQIYNVTNTDTAKSLYGASSPIIQLMRHAFAGGAKNVALYRIGGSAASIENLFGEYTTLRTLSESVSAGTDLKVYAGPRNNDPTTSIVIVYSGTKIVYSNSPGQEVDLGVVSLDGFDATEFKYLVGTMAAPVAFKDVVTNLKVKSVETFEGDGTKTTFTLKKTDAKVIQIVSNVNGVITTVASSAYTAPSNTVTFTTAPVKGAVLQIASSTAADVATAGIKYVAGADNMSATYNKLYELYDSAFVELEAYSVFSTVIEDLFNVPNIAIGSPATEDRLTYVKREEGDYDDFKYTWSDFKYIYRRLSDPGLTTTDVSLAALDTNGVPIIVDQFHEVDFGHRLAYWAWTQSDIGHYVNGVIGPRPPKANYTLAINRWIGKKPTSDTYGTITVNGEGLLGNRFISGTTKQSAGFYATDTGYPDGDPIYDSGNVLVDIGKHLSIPVMPVYLASDLYTSSGATIRSASSAYAGLITRVSPGDSTTNLVIPGVTPLFKLKASKLIELSTAGYVVFEEKSKGITVYSGELATSEDSDYDYISTAISITHVLKNLRDVIDPYIGRGLSEALLTSLHNAIDSELRVAIKDGYINGFDFNLLGTDANTLKMPLAIKPKHELRVVNIVLSLSPQDLFSI